MQRKEKNKIIFNQNLFGKRTIQRNISESNFNFVTQILKPKSKLIGNEIVSVRVRHLIFLQASEYLLRCFRISRFVKCP